MDEELKEYNFMAWIDFKGGSSGDRWRLKSYSRGGAFDQAQELNYQEQEEIGEERLPYTRFEMIGENPDE